MNEDRLNPEAKRLAEVWKKSQELTGKTHSLSVDLDLMRRSTPKSKQPKTKPVLMKELVPSRPKIKQTARTSVAKTNRKASRTEANSRGAERKALTLSEIRKHYNQANENLIARIKSYRFAGVQGIQVR